MRRIWPKVAKIYWDPDYDLPVVKPRHGQIDLFYVVKLTEPGDARPGFKRDYERLRESIIYEFGDDKIYRELFDRFILLNKVPHWDQMWEIVSSGNVWGQLYYDPFKRMWRFRLTYSGAYYAYHNRLVDYIRISRRVKKREVLGRKSTGSRQVVVVDENDQILGLAENVNGEYVVTKIFRGGKPPVETSFKHATLDDVLKHNLESIEHYRDRSVVFLRKIYERNKLPVVVSYSGGKDSLVALHLTLEAIGDAHVLFNDTGLELPETLQNVEQVVKQYGLELVEAKAGNAFWDAVKIFGPPGKDYRWCCKVAKLVPIARTTRAKWPSGALNIVGQRAFESMDRAKSPVVWRNKWVPHLLSTTPIQDWSQLVVWLYIYRYKLPYNPLYDVGYERLGCYLCPSSTLAEFSEVEKRYPCLWRKWVEILEYWREKLHQPVEWITLGLWRWLTPSMAKYRLARHVEGYSINWRREYLERLLNSSVGLAPINKAVEGDELTVVFNKKLLDEAHYSVFESNILMLGGRVKRVNETLVVETPGTRIVIDGEKIKASPYTEPVNLEDLVDVLKTIYRIRGCSRCGSCVLWCPTRIIRLTRYGPKPFNLDMCSRCRICVDVCPVAEMIVEKIVVPLITGDPKAWRRPSRRRAEEEIETTI